MIVPYAFCPNCESNNIEHYYYIDYFYNKNHLEVYELYCDDCNLELHEEFFIERKEYTKKQSIEIVKKWEEKFNIENQFDYWKYDEKD